MTSNVAMKWAMGDCKIIILEAREICNDMPTTFKTRRKRVKRLHSGTTSDKSILI